MLIPQARKTLFLNLLGVIILASILFGFVLKLTANGTTFISEPLHSTLEGIGAVEAILMALLLLHLFRNDGDNRHLYFLIAMGFLMMGILDAFHSITTIHHGFVLLRSLACIFSGFWFVLVWSPSSARRIDETASFQWIIPILSILLGISIISVRGLFPLMLAQDSGFTTAAIAINALAGLFTIAAGVFFLRRYLADSTTEAYLFAATFLLLGLAGLEFPFSGLWTPLWWFWHAERFLAYIVVLVYMVRLFLWKSHELMRINASLEERISRRTQELENEVVERTRYAQERDRVIADLQDAQRRIKTLTGLLPICASCKKIRNTEGRWEKLESYIHQHSEANFTHSICPDCVKRLYPDLKL